MAAAVDAKLLVASPKTVDRYRVITAVISAAAPAALIVIVLTLFQQALPAIQHYGPAFLIRSVWNPVTLDFGALPYIYGTVVTSAIALAIALPVGVAVSLLLAEQGLDEWASELDAMEGN